MRKIKVLELFSGYGTISEAFKKRGHIVATCDWDSYFKDRTTFNKDVRCLTVEEVASALGGTPDVIWASPDCTTYSVAGIWRHRREADGSLIPISDYAIQCDDTNNYVLKELIPRLNPAIWFIENPRGGFRKMSFAKDLPRYTITYCQYGETRMKPTDIFTNHPCPQFKPPCHNGDKCHEPAPRGSNTSTTALSGHYKRSQIPQLLAEHIVDICENYFQNKDRSREEQK